MKKILLLACLFVFAGLSSVSAQCSKSAKTSCAKTCAKTAAVAAKVADKDDNIVKRLDDEGNAFYVRKAVDTESGKVTFTDVKYCTKSNAFINKSPSQVASATAMKTSDKAAKMGCSKDKSKSCCASKAKVAGTAKAQEAAKPQAIMVKQVEKN